jgi:hypothetical protein
MAKEQIATWYSTVSERAIKKEISEQFVSTIEDLTTQIDSESSDEQDTIITQIIAITAELLSGDNGDYRFMSATIINQLITLFSNTSRANEIITQSLEVISEWNTGSNYNKQVAINAAGQVAVNISNLSKMTLPYANQIFTLFNNAATDANSNVREGASNVLGDIVQVFVTAFSGAAGMDAYITQLYTSISNLITDSSYGVRISAATAMLTVITTLANAGTLSTYTHQTLTILTSLTGDSDSSVRNASIEILEPLLLSISGMPIYNTQSQWLLNKLNVLMFDEDAGVRDSASKALQIATAWIGDNHVSYLVTIAKIETIINLDLRNYSNSETIRDAVVNAIPEKLTEYNERLDAANASDLTVISNNFSAITGLISIIGTVGTEALQAGSDGAQITLDKIVTKLISNDISVANFCIAMEWIDNNFDNLIVQPAAAETFLQTIFNTIITHENINAMEAAFITKCASAGYGFVTLEHIKNTTEWLNSHFEHFEALGSYDPEGIFQPGSYEAVLRKELADGTVTDVDVALAGKCLGAGYDFVTSVDEEAGTYTMS